MQVASDLHCIMGKIKSGTRYRRSIPRLLFLLIHVDTDSLTAVPSGSSLVAVGEERGKLARCWHRLPLRHRLRLLEGLPDVEKEATAAVRGESGGDCQGCDDVIGDLVLAPASLCFKVGTVEVMTPVHRDLKIYSVRQVLKQYVLDSRWLPVHKSYCKNLSWGHYMFFSLSERQMVDPRWMPKSLWTG